MIDFVIKVGTGVISKEDKEVDEKTIEGIAKVVKKLFDEGRRGVIVSSGAIFLGLKKLNLKKVPKDILHNQMLSSVGQPYLLQLWQRFLPMPTSQILLTYDDIAQKHRAQKIKNLIKLLLSKSIVPIVNENDTVSVEEIKLGDNDILSAYICALLDSKKFIILSDIDGIFGENGSIIKVLDFSKPPPLLKLKRKFFFAGGISTKFAAMKIACEFGAHSYLINGKRPEGIIEIFEGKNPGTMALPFKKQEKRKVWIGKIIKGKGKIEIDEGAFRALQNRKSLLPVGIRKVNGNFFAGDVVEISLNGKTVAKGISNYSSEEIKLIAGKKSTEIQKILGYSKGAEVIHIDNLYFVDEEM